MNEPKAFPFEENHESGSIDSGMDLRDYFAAKVLQGLIMQTNIAFGMGTEIVNLSYKFADEMMKERNK